MGLSAARVSRSPDSRRSPSSNPASLRGTPKGSEMRVAATAAVVRLDNSGRVPTHRGRILGHTDDAPTTGWWMKEVYGLHAASRWSCSRESAEGRARSLQHGAYRASLRLDCLPGLTVSPGLPARRCARNADRCRPPATSVQSQSPSERESSGRRTMAATLHDFHSHRERLGSNACTNDQRSQMTTRFESPQEVGSSTYRRSAVLPNMRALAVARPPHDVASAIRRDCQATAPS